MALSNRRLRPDGASSSGSIPGRLPGPALALALEAYRGGRTIVSDEVASPTAFARKGIIAGCPLAPTLSKLAVGESIRQTCGGRVIVSDEVASPTAYARKSIITGCPLAPTLSKLAVGDSIRQTCVGPDIDYVGTWIDDISVDVENRHAERAAAAVVQSFKKLDRPPI
ncbi:hypothetical protein AK812_SmicGene31166 [Symbiodinium microadriaticum]|uniref:Uncharacterized protein n=1 Tax=Symbiodinium microadriaticum TaxID=2951 RepID=A0A1Q9CXI4_SYMMI|nr:hypothetical protein AK812_SmicGene31166 [Symbiodinium microadriaticum]